MVFPEGDFSHDEGVALTVHGADRVVGDVRSGGVHQVLFDWRDGLDASRADREMSDAGLTVLTNDDALEPATVTNLGEVVALPRFLAFFVGLLGLATFAHAVSVTIRRRSSELATMRAIGITRRGTAGLLGSQAIVLGAVMLLAGVPLGLAVGRAVWRPIAEGAHVVVLAVWPWGAVGLIVGAVVLTGGMLAAFAAWKAARLGPAALLRTE
jgi:ABC-type antimicrobial peptide transport system permease subunit